MARGSAEGGLRIASLLPSATEIVCAVGARENLVGVSHECDYPAGVDALPVLTRTRRALPASSGAIDRAVREILREAVAVYEVDLERLCEAAPSVVVTQDLCDVCAVSLDDVRTALRSLLLEDVALVNLRPARLAHVWDDVRRVGCAAGRADEGQRVAAGLERRTAQIARRAQPLPERPTVLTIEWLDPVMIGGTWMPELATLAGGRPLVTAPGEHAPTLSRGDLEALDPDVVLVKPCGFDLARTREQAELFRRKLPWDRWTAAREERVFAADGNAYFNRPGPRLVESLEILAACLHPDAFADLARRHAASFQRVTPDLEFVPGAAPAR